MKKISIVLIASVMAVGFSAFTLPSRHVQQLYYWDGDSMEEYNEGNECEPGDQVPCVIPVFGTLYTDDVHEDEFIYKKD